jgi:hypothetical protein
LFFLEMGDLHTTDEDDVWFSEFYVDDFYLVVGGLFLLFGILFQFFVQILLNKMPQFSM